MKYNLYAIGAGLHRNIVPKDNQIIYTLVRISRYGDYDLIDNASEDEAVKVARLIKNGGIQYDQELDQYRINHSGATHRHPVYLGAMCYVSWTNSFTEHVHFSNPDLFADPDHFEIVEQDCTRRYLFKETLTTEIPF